MQCQHQPGAILYSESIDFDDKIYVYFIKTIMSYMTKKNYLNSQTKLTFKTFKKRIGLFNLIFEIKKLSILFFMYILSVSSYCKYII